MEDKKIELINQGMLDCMGYEWMQARGDYPSAEFYIGFNRK